MTLQISSLRALLPLFTVACALAVPMRAQQLIGYVNPHDAEVVGATDTIGGEAVLTGSVSVRAKERTASIRLSRGGAVRVCQTSVLHLSESREMMVAAPLLFSLDVGAIEIQTKATPTDAVMTPDLRFTVSGSGPLDLRLRVAGNGDTCVENRGAGAPTLNVSDPFSDAMYELTASQHVLFEHGSLHEVVDHETSPCGCPDEVSLADALPVPVAGMGAGAAAVAPASQAAAQHPFPVAISEGLAPGSAVPQAAPDQVHVQVAETLRYNAEPGSAAAGAPADSGAPPAVAPAPAPPVNDLAHLVGRFFRKLFRHG